MKLKQNLLMRKQKQKMKKKMKKKKKMEKDIVMKLEQQLLIRLIQWLKTLTTKALERVEA